MCRLVVTAPLTAPWALRVAAARSLEIPLNSRQTEMGREGVLRFRALWGDSDPAVPIGWRPQTLGFSYLHWSLTPGEDAEGTMLV